MATIAMYGAGMMGAGMVRRMLENGETVRVWNRSPEKAKALEADGAVAVAGPLETLKGAAQVHIMLSDDAAVDALLEKIAGAIPAGVPVIDHTTVTPMGTLARAEKMAKAGVAFLHAPVFMSPANCREGTGIMLVAGPPELYRRVEPFLAKMTGKIVDYGAQPDRAAAFKLFGNHMILVLSSGVADTLMLAKSSGIDGAEALKLFETFNPAGALGFRGKKMVEKDFDPPSFELVMARKDARLMIETAQAAGNELVVLPAVVKRMDELIERGLGAKDSSVVGIDAV